MRKITIDLPEVGSIVQSLTHYQQLGSYLPQLDPAQRETLDKFWKERVLAHAQQPKFGEKYMDGQAYQYWQQVDMHVVKQHWGNTSCGWEGIGGAAMSESYTVVLENRWLKAIFVYYDGKLAYIADMDDKLKPYMEKGFHSLPGMGSVASRLTCIYRNIKNRT